MYETTDDEGMKYAASLFANGVKIGDNLEHNQRARHRSSVVSMDHDYLR